MKIILDAFGGDNAPLCNIEGAVMARDEYGCDIILVGDTERIERCAQENNISIDGIEIVQADGIFGIHDDPNTILKAGADTSLSVALKLAAEGKGDAVVSAGSTGALIFGATFIIKRIKGIKRPALAPVMPTSDGPCLLIDCGANLDVRPEILMDFARMGSVYMKNVMNVENPRVGLLNVGAEDTKGGEMLVETYQLMKNSPDINFVGNTEPRDVLFSACDVLVTDGFSGNIVLKLTEGAAMYFMGMIKNVFMSNIMTKIAGLLVKPKIKTLKKKMDHNEIGGAPLLGLSKPVIKAHGSSNNVAIKNAIRQAIAFTKTGVIDEISGQLSVVSGQKGTD